MDRFDQVIIDLRVDIGLVERRLKRAVVLAHFCKEIELFHLCRQDCSRGIFVLIIGFVQGVKRVFSDISVIILHQWNKTCMGYSKTVSLDI